MFTVVEACGVCLALSIFFVSSLYVSDFLCGATQSNVTDRNAPETIVRRSIGATFASATSIVILLCIRSLEWGKSDQLKFSILLILGLRADHLIISIILPLILTTMLFLGPVLWLVILKIEEFLDEANGGSLSDRLNNIFRKDFYFFSSLPFDIIVWRNYIIAPITEELVFRACMCPILLWGNLSVVQTIFIGPFFFGVAHLHHFWQYVHHQQMPPRTAALITGIQFTYTTVFGWYTSFLFLRTGNLMSPIVVHALCNVLGLPNFTAVAQHPYKWGIFPAFLVGVFFFVAFLGKLTEPQLYNKEINSHLCHLGFGFSCWGD